MSRTQRHRSSWDSARVLKLNSTIRGGQAPRNGTGPSGSESGALLRMAPPMSEPGQSPSAAITPLASSSAPSPSAPAAAAWIKSDDCVRFSCDDPAAAAATAADADLGSPANRGLPGGVAGSVLLDALSGESPRPEPAPAGSGDAAPIAEERDWPLGMDTGCRMPPGRSADPGPPLARPHATERLRARDLVLPAVEAVPKAACPAAGGAGAAVDSLRFRNCESKERCSSSAGSPITLS
mmetsp:Transcript_466/g.1740  ORF Transcript_466/g.1740 Transcript_466/m.1740 type:complete len:238 (-) Transcript_466:3108-3821(-)